MSGTTVVATVDDSAISAATALLESAYDLLVFLWHAIAIPLEILGTVGSEDLLYGTHESIPCISWATR